MITLAQAIPLKSNIAKLLHQYIQERRDVSTVVAKSKDDVKNESPSRTMNQVTEDLEKVRYDLRKLEVLIAQANLANTIAWDNGPITITEAIELAKQLRAEADSCDGFGAVKKVCRETGYNSSSDLITFALFEPEEYRTKGQKLRRIANKLSNLIEEKNHSVQLDFDAALYID